LCDALSEIQAVKTSVKTHNTGTENIQAIDDVMYNIQNSISALGPAESCTVGGVLSTPITSIQIHYQNAFTKLRDILFVLDSYKKSNFCSH
jgi:hypothetical protein